LIPTPETGTEIEMTYYASVQALSDASPTNWVSLEWPSLYIYGSLRHAAPYLKEDERVGVWENEYRAALERARLADQKAQYSGAPMMIRSTTFG
jgi:hypothetical protein